MSDNRPDLASVAGGGVVRAEPLDSDRRALDRRLAGGVVWTATAKVLSQLVAWTCTIFVARLLYPSDYGLLGMSGVYIGFVQLVTELGLANAVIFFRSLNRHQIAQLNTLALAVSSAAMGLSVVVAPLVARFYNEPRLSPIIMVSSISFLVLGLRTVPYGLMERAMDFRYLAMLEIGQGAVTGPLTLVLAWLGFGYWSLVIGGLVGLSVGTIVMILRDPCGFALPRLSELREALRLSYHLVVARVAWYAYSNSDYAVVGRMLGTEPLGAYSLAFTIASTPVEKVTVLLVRVARPAFASVQDRPHEVKRVFLLTSAGLALVTIPASIGLAALAPELVTTVFGEKWREAIVPLSLLALCTPIRSLAPLLPQILNATGDSAFAMRVNLVAALLLPVSFAIASVAGLAAVALVWVLVYPLFVVPAALRVSRRIGLTGREYLAATGPPAIGAAIMGVLLLAARAAIPGDWPPPIRLALLVLVGGAIFSGVMLTAFRSRTLAYFAALRNLRER